MTFFNEEIAKRFKSFDDEMKGYYLQNFIHEMGIDLTKDKKDYFLQKETVIRLVGEIVGLTESDTYYYLNLIKSSFANKYAILGYWNGKKITKSEVSGNYKNAVEKLKKIYELENSTEGGYLIDALQELLKVESL